MTGVYVRVYWGWYFGHFVLKANLSGIKNLKAKVTHLKKKNKKTKQKLTLVGRKSDFFFKIIIIILNVHKGEIERGPTNSY